MKRAKLLLIFISALILTSCGGGGDSISDTPSANNVVPSSAISGIAAAGAPIAGGIVLLTDSLGAPLSTSTDQYGYYQIDVASLTPPFVLKITDQHAKVYLSVATEDMINTTVNITPLTHVVVAKMFGVAKPQDVGGLDFSKITRTRIREKSLELAAQLSSVIAAVTTQVVNDFMSGTLAGNNQGMDAILDAIQIVTGLDYFSIVNRATPSESIVFTDDTIDNIDHLPATGISERVAALEAMKTQLKNAVEAIQYNRSTAGVTLSTIDTALITALHTDFKDSGLTKTLVIAYLNNPDISSIQIENFIISSMDDGGGDFIAFTSATVSFTSIINENGAIYERKNFYNAAIEDGIWKLLGNGNLYNVNPYAGKDSRQTKDILTGVKTDLLKNRVYFECDDILFIECELMCV